MFFPIKVKFFGWNKVSLRNINDTDPEKKMKSLNAIRIGRIFKTTSSNRFPKTLEFLEKKNNFYKNILEIGCSDGTSSIDLIEKLRFGSFFCMDKFIQLNLGFYKSNPFLMDAHNNVHMYENRFALIYLDPFSVHNSPFEFLISKFFLKKFKSKFNSKIVEMINPKLKNYPNVYIRNFDIFEDELTIKSDLIVVFNLLNLLIISIYAHV